MIDLLTSEIQYLSHLSPLWHGLPVEQRGCAFVRYPLVETAAAEGIMPVQTGRVPPSSNPTLVASWQDSNQARQLGRPTIYVEHGCGQQYRGDERVTNHPSYAGSPQHDGTILFICPRRSVAAAWEARYPTVATVVAGCPKLDYLHRHGRTAPLGRPLAVISTHSDLPLVPETRSALPHYQHALAKTAARLRAEGVELAGHAHPRFFRHARPIFERAGLDVIEDFGEVLVRASVFAADNTSALPEAASVGIPLVWLNCPWYQTTHGGRFWTWPEGQVTCDQPEDLANAILRALEDPVSVREARERMVGEVYCAVDGKAAERAVAAILTASERLAL